MSEQSVVVVVETGIVAVGMGGLDERLFILVGEPMLSFISPLSNHHLITALRFQNMAAANHCSRPNLRLSAALY